MKQNLFYLTFFTLFISSCCKVDLATGITMRYPNLEGHTELTVYTVTKGNPTDIRDTVLTTELNAENNYTYFVRFRSPETYDYLIEVDSTYSDTITNYTYETDGFNCNTHVESNSYLHNGTPQTNTTLEIH